MAHHFTAGEGALWTQPGGPNTPPVYLGCHEIGDIDEPQGDVELIYCPDPSGPNRFMVVNSLQGSAGAITATVTTDVTDELDYLERARCATPIYVHMVQAGLKNVFTNYDRSFVLTNARVTSRGVSSLTTRAPDNNQRAEMTFDLAAETLIRAVRMSMSRQGISEVQSIKDVSFCNAEECRSATSPGYGSCQIGFATTAAGAAATAKVLMTINGGAWAATVAAPFAVDVDLGGVECFEMGRNTTRVIVSRGETVAGQPAAIAYSDDSGATWVTVTVGANVGAFITTQALRAIGRSDIWAGTSLGYIYHSGDGGVTWDVQEAGIITSTAWNSIDFADADVGWAAGVANEIARTIDGGVGWSPVNGPVAQSGVAINTIHAVDRNRAWIGYANGKLYYTNDAGVTWVERGFSGSGVGSVADIDFIDEYMGVLVRNNGSNVGAVLTTIDGGYTWEPMTTPTNSGLTVAHVCDYLSFFVTGNANSGSGFIAKATA